MGTFPQIELAGIQVRFKDPFQDRTVTEQVGGAKLK